ncbi:MAG: LamG-like jellyroll fold domain-containing protein, partial [Planctomycetaceae bacterium]
MSIHINRQTRRTAAAVRNHRHMHPLIQRQLLPLNEWVHVTVVSDGSSSASGLSIYVNGHRAETDIIRDS